jgi:hypothetical protein
MKTRLLFFIIIVAVCCIQCKYILEPGGQDNRVILKFRFMHGWTGQISAINIQANRVITDTTGAAKQTSLTGSEWRQLNNFLVNFTEIKTQFIPSDGAFCDFDQYWLIKYPESKADTIFIYEGLDSERIPDELRTMVKLLKKKL